MIAQPSSPDKVVSVRNIAGAEVHQVCIGSCTNSSHRDLGIAAHMLRGRTVSPRVSMTVTPGSKQVLEMIARDGSLADLIAAGARILESGCGPCIGNGQAPPSGATSVRSFNRNFEGRSGTRDARVFLASTETCVACAINGSISDPRDLGVRWADIQDPVSPSGADAMIIPPPADASSVEVARGPNIVSLGSFSEPDAIVEGRVLIKVGDNVTTDHIMPAGRWLKYRSNVPKYSEAVFNGVDPEFPKRCSEWNGGIVVGGENYGQGSSREHAALVPRWMGVKAVIVKSFARIHEANLVNFGIVPLVFASDRDYNAIQQGDALEIPGLREALEMGVATLTVRNLTRKTEFEVKHSLTERARKVVLAGGMLNFVRK